MANIVMLNLAEKEGGGPTDKLLRSLKKKYPTLGWLSAKFWGQNTVVELSLFELMKAHREGTLNTRAYLKIRDEYMTDINKHAKKLEVFAAADLIKVNQLCLSADKIFLCIHGKYNDNGRGFAHLELDSGNTPTAAVTDWKSLASFLNVLFPVRTSMYNLALIMCYAARTAHFRLDQQGQVDPEELKTSFAYKLFASVCRNRPLRMTARTGAVGFNPDTGHSNVETDEAVLARADRDEFDHERATAEVYEKIQALKERMTTRKGGASDDTVKKWLAMDKKFKDNPDAAAADDDEAIMKAYRAAVLRREEYGRQMQSKDKYGKIVYNYQNDQLTIFAKYPKPGALLYQGELIPVA
jgi:hypothetical protein